MFGFNNQTNPPNQQGGLFSNMTNTNNTNNPTSLFGNNQSNTGNLFGNTSNSNTTTNNNQKFNFGAPATNNPNTGTSPLSGIFQNNLSDISACYDKYCLCVLYKNLTFKIFKLF